MTSGFGATRGKDRKNALMTKMAEPTLKISLLGSSLGEEIVGIRFRLARVGLDALKRRAFGL